MMYAHTMKRLQIMIDADLDEALGGMSRQQRTSKAAIIRALVRQRVRPLPPLEDEPLSRLIGAYDEAPGSIDDAVYR